MASGRMGGAGLPGRPIEIKLSKPATSPEPPEIPRPRLEAAGGKSEVPGKDAAAKDSNAPPLTNQVIAAARRSRERSVPTQLPASRRPTEGAQRPNDVPSDGARKPRGSDASTNRVNDIPDYSKCDAQSGIKNMVEASSVSAVENQPGRQFDKNIPSAEVQKKLENIAEAISAYKARLSDHIHRRPRWPVLSDRIENVREILTGEGKVFKTGDRPAPDIEAISARIEKDSMNANPAIKLEGEAGKIAQENSNVVGYQKEIWSDRRIIGEIDVLTSNAVVEVTTQGASGSGKGPQILKEVGDRDINPLGKPVVVYAPKWSLRIVTSFEARNSKVIVARTPDELAFCLRQLPHLE